MKQILLIGDSLTQRGFETEKCGWAGLLAHDYIRRADIINRGFGGYNTEWCRLILPTILSMSMLSPLTLALYVIFLGANDAVLPGERQHVPLKKYEENLEQMVADIRHTHSDAKILFITPPPIYEKDWREYRLAQGRNCDRKFEHSLMYSESCAAVASRLRIPVLPLHQVFFNETWHALGMPDNVDPVQLSDEQSAEFFTTLQTFFCDGLHFSARGNKLVHSALMKAIAKHFPQLTPTSLKNFVTCFFGGVDTIWKLVCNLNLQSKMWHQTAISLQRPRGCHLITDEILRQLPQLSGFHIGLANFFLQHSSASLTINENCDKDVRKDMEMMLNRIAPEDAPYIHTDEGSDDMVAKPSNEKPGHVKSSLFGVSLTIPISNGKLALGTWQGIWLCEHRNRGGTRKIIVTLQGDPM